MHIFFVFRFSLIMTLSSLGLPLGYRVHNSPYPPTPCPTPALLIFGRETLLASSPFSNTTVSFLNYSNPSN